MSRKIQISNVSVQLDSGAEPFTQYYDFKQWREDALAKGYDVHPDEYGGGVDGYHRWYAFPRIAPLDQGRAVSYGIFDLHQPMQGFLAGSEDAARDATERMVLGPLMHHSVLLRRMKNTI